VHEHLAELLPRLKMAADRRVGLDPTARAHLEHALVVAQSDYDAAHATPAAGEEPATEMSDRADPVDTLAEIFGLDEIDTAVLIAAAAAELDANLALVVGRLRGLDGPARLSVGLALELAGLGTLDPAGIEHLGATSRLRRGGLVELGNGSWLSREVSVPERVLGHLLGSAPVEPAVRVLAVYPIPLELTGHDILAGAIAEGAPLAWVHGRTGTAGLSLAAAGFHTAGVPSLTVDLDRAGPQGVDTELLRVITREAALLGAGLVIGSAERLIDGDRAGALGLLVDAPIPVIAVGTRPWEQGWLPHFPITVEAPGLTPSDRSVAWEAAGADPEMEAGLAGLRLTPEAIVQTAGYARRLASARGEELTAELVRQAARRVGGSSAPVRNTGHRTRFADLILPNHVEVALRRLVGWARHRDEALSRGSLLELGRKGAGLAALFTGSPGTGKTLAAHVVADELGIDLVQVDLSAIVDKYIGETEKNLERVFQQAESLNVVLFFDEADALFGKRSEVKDSHDRHANQEVAYLLQRMENFDGLTILATNLRGNLDVAFSRRMNFIVHFPDPDVPTRRRLWQAHLDRLGPLDPSDPLPLDDLAEVVDLPGGDIRNIVLAAGYDAAAAGELPGLRHVRAATIGEYQKLGRRVPATQLLKTEVG
jgi:predicted nucleic acid-binding protein